ncbi:MAG: hypothetical protein AAF614_38050 [Chloroflexota bacterium]
MRTLQLTWQRNKNSLVKLLTLAAGVLLINLSLLVDVRLAILWILGFLLVVQVVKPIVALIFLIPVYFRGFGFLPRQFLGQLLGFLEPRDLAFIFLLALTIALCFLSPRVLTRIRYSVLFIPIVVLLGYVLFRIVLTGLEIGEPVLALRAGRRYLGYLLYFVTIAFISNRQTGKLLINSLIVMGVVIAFMNFVAQVAPAWFAPFFAGANNLTSLEGYGGALGVKLHVPGRFIMFLAFLWLLFRWLQYRRPADLLLVGILGGGFLVQKYRTFYLILPLAVMLVWFLLRKSRKETYRQMRLLITVTMLVVLGLGVALLLSSGLREDVARFAWEAWASATGEISTGTFQDRLQRAAWRMELFQTRPFLGIGFVHDSLAQRLFNQDSIGITWIGYADVLLTGGLLLAAALGWVVMASWRYLSRWLRQQQLNTDASWVVAGSLAFSVMATLGMISWSLLSIDDGIVPLALALALAERFISFEKDTAAKSPARLSEQGT